MSYASGLLYNGNWENGERHHYGILINPTGERYEGEWIRGIRHGKGRMEHFEGSVYDGYWKEGYVGPSTFHFTSLTLHSTKGKAL